jgi:5-(carboxyamino)imidazole ribonucleotide mutase
MHVGIVMGSDSDLPAMKKAFEILDGFGVTYDVAIASAHRTPKKLSEFVAAEEEKGAGAFIAGAGMAAALPGVVASLTLRPVIGVPLSGAKLDGMDALFSIVQMPSGIPVATVAIDGTKNAAFLAIEIGAVSDRELYRKYKEYREEAAAEIYRKDEKLQKGLGR